MGKKEPKKIKFGSDEWMRMMRSKIGKKNR
jgi:hypothetical protein